MWIAPERGACAILMAAGAVLLGARLDRRVARNAWLVLLALGIVHALALNLHSLRRANINLIHHYLGAKYAVPYTDFYRLVQAARDEPPFGIRDLDHPDRLLNERPEERRAWYIDLLRRRGVTFTPVAPLDSLASVARSSGALAADADSVLRARLPAARVAEFRHDVRWAVSGLDWQVLEADYGFNGSPFYALLRRADPTLHRPLGGAAVLAAVLAQVAGALLLAWVIGEALALDFTGRVAAAALLFASWDFAGFALSGLVFSELWLPVALAALALRHRRAALAGVAVAGAGLLKLFPFVLLLPAAVPILVRRRGSKRDAEPSRAWLPRVSFVASAAVSAAILAWAATWSGRSWREFLLKIQAEFQAGFFLANSVSHGAALLVLGVNDSMLYRVIPLVAITFLLAMFAGSGEEPSESAVPRRMLVLIAATGWLVRNWLNYYAVLPLLLLPGVARRHRLGATISVAGTALTFALPEFNSPILIENPALHAIKLLPYLAVPAWLVALELRALPWGRWPRRAAAATLSLLALATAVETWRGGAVRDLRVRVRGALDAGDPEGALAGASRWVRLDPGNAAAHRNRGIALATLGRMDEAGPEFAKAVRLSPGDPATLDDLGRYLLMQGRVEAAGVQFEAAHRAAPADVEILVMLARLRATEGRGSESIALLRRAVELDPGNADLAALVREAHADSATSDSAAAAAHAAPRARGRPSGAP